MCGMKTLIALAFGLTALFQAPPVFAQSADLRLFATCAGRLSALMEHQWLLSDPASDQTARQRKSMLSLVAAMAGPDAARALNWRIEAKAAQASLLARARFGTNEATAARSAQRSDLLDLIHAVEVPHRVLRHASFPAEHPREQRLRVASNAEQLHQLGARDLDDLLVGLLHDLLVARPADEPAHEHRALSGARSGHFDDDQRDRQ